MVVGGTSGIGLATAQRLVAAGDRVMLVARDEGRLAEVAGELGGLSGAVGYAAADVSDAAAVEAAVAATVERHGRLDAVVTSAQGMAYGTLEQVPAEVVRHLSDVAVGGTINLAQACLPVFRRQGHGSLVVVSSLLAQVPVASMGAYCAAKWGQLGLVRTLQTEVRWTRGIDVSLVLPGAIDTPIYRQAGTWAGRGGSAPPPVLAADRVAAACVRCLDRPRRQVHVGPANRVVVLASRLAPAVYDRLVGPLAGAVVLRGPRSGPDAGNVFEAVPEGEGVSDGWHVLGLRRTEDGRLHWSARGRG